MIHVNNFTNGALNPLLAYLLSAMGCFLGLRCTTRARAYQGAARARWLTAGALAIGSTGIWVMHFIAMLGFSIPDQSHPLQRADHHLVHGDRRGGGRDRDVHRRVTGTVPGRWCWAA